LSEKNIEDETYSLIFTSLKHPVRRRILRMLSTKSLSFSEILEILSIDSGHLSYHLESLGDLIGHTNNGQYKLSSFGASAVRLMSGVEEQKGNNSTKHLITVYSIILSLILISACFPLVTYSTVVSSRTLSTDYLVVPTYQSIPFDVGSGETFELNVTLQYQHPSRDGIGLEGGNKKWIFKIPRLKQNAREWDESTISFDSTYNTTSFFSEIADAITLTMGNKTTQPPQDFNVTVYFPKLTTDITKVMNPSNLNLEISTPAGELISGEFYVNENRIDTIHSLPLKFTHQGTYIFRITNKSEWDWNGSLTCILKFQHYEKPYVILGTIGLMIALGYILLVTMMSYKWNKEKSID